MADGKGIRRLVQLVVDKAAALKVKRQLSKALDDGTDPKKAKKNIRVIQTALGGLAKAALKVGAAFAVFIGGRALLRFGKDAVRVAAEAEDIWTRLAKAIDLTGTSFADVEQEIKKTARAFQDATQIGDEQFAEILTELITTSGKYAESLEHVETVANLAAAKQIDLKAAAMLVGRAMVGQTQTLTRYGIVIAEGADVMDTLREKFAGFARVEATTFAGKIAQINNEWQDFKQAVGEAVTEAEGAEGVLETLRATIEQLTLWVDRNRGQLQEFAADMLRAASAVGKFVGKVLDLIDPWGEFARAQRENIALLETEQELLDRRNWLFDQLLKAAAKENEIKNRSAVRRKLLGEQQERDIENNLREIRVLKGLIDHIDQLTTAQEKNAVAPPVSATGAPVLGGPGKGLLDKRDVPAREQPVVVPEIFGLLSDQAAERFADSVNMFRDANAQIEGIAQNTAWAVQNAWGNAFELMISGAATTGQVIQALAAGMGQALLGGLASFASGKVAENIAFAFEEHAKGLAAAANPFTAPMAALHFAAAKGFGLSALKWSLMAGVAGGASASLGGAARGGGGGFQGGASDGLRSNPRGDRMGPEINIFIDPLDPDNPAYQDHLQRTIGLATERWGDQIPVRIHRNPRSG